MPWKYFLYTYKYNNIKVNERRQREKQTVKHKFPFILVFLVYMY